MGEIKTWNDPAIAKLNASAKPGPAANRSSFVHRSERVRHDLHLDRTTSQR